MTLNPFGRGDGYISHAKRVAEVPEGPHWVILTEESVTTWSGYKDDPGSPEAVLRYHPFTDEVKWKATILKIEKENMQGGSSRCKYIAFHVDRRASTQIEIKVT